VPTGVDVEYFRRPAAQAAPHHDLIFIGAMDWLPNIDGTRFFIREVLPLIRAQRPDCTLVLAGRSPVAELQAFADADPLITVTGTVPDIRPYLWNARVSIVPLRIGGGTRLKVYEAMAAGLPVVSTYVGAEGLTVQNGVNVLLSDDARSFADSCLALLNDQERGRAQSSAALELVTTQFSWSKIAEAFEEILRRAA
jgi:glycosyltransferase involved in cell wall biosynthesis